MKTRVANLVRLKPTVKFLNFLKPENFAVNYLKFKQRSQTLGYFIKKDANGIANSEDPDQTALEEQSDLGLHYLPRHICQKTLDHYGTCTATLAS